MNSNNHVVQDPLRKLQRDRSAIRAVIENPLKFCSLLNIVDKSGKNARLKLNGEQTKIISSLHSGKDTLILKPRQIGSTTAVAAFFFWKWITAPGPETYVILSHKMGSSRHILGIHKRFYDALPGPLKRELSTDNGGGMTLKDTGATIMAASAEGKGGLRSFTATGLHISEYAFSENPEELKATALSALNGGQLCIESTANYYGDSLHKEIELYASGTVDWEFLFFPWTDHLEYVLDKKDKSDSEFPKDGPLTIEQFRWQKKMSGQLGQAKFQREYPLTVDEAYAQTDGSWVSLEDLKDITILVVASEGEQLAKYDPRDRYAVGVDLGAGTGGDNSVVMVISVSTSEIVEIRRSNTIPPVEFSEIIASISRKWGNAKVLVEENGTFGGIVISELKFNGIPQWKHADTGNSWQTNGRTKPKMLEHLKDSILKCKITTLDSATVGELRSFIIDDRNIVSCPRTGLHHGDSVIALALAHQCALSVKVPERQLLPDWIVKRKIDLARRSASKQELRRY